jgi:hypothetical protein
LYTALQLVLGHGAVEPELSVRRSSNRDPISSRRDRKAYLEIVNCAANRNVSNVVNEPMRTSSCSTYVLIARCVASGSSWPLTRILPLMAAVCRCARALSRVVLPAPEGPIRAIIWPAHESATHHR